MDGVGLLFALTLPGLVCLLVALVALERFGLWAGRSSWLPWRRRAEPSGRQPRRAELSAAGLDELSGWLYAGKRLELDQRNTELMLRDDSLDGAPPVTVDPVTGAVLVRPPAPLEPS